MAAVEQQRNMSKSVTRLLQHSILQLCNEHIGYTHKLQILGVLCMTVDDEQQELVVKVNNTLKRVNPAAPKESSPSPLVHYPQTNATTPHAVPVTVPLTVHDDIEPSDTLQNGSSSSPVPPTSGRKSHGRKGTNPVKVEHVYDDREPQSDDDEDEPVTVIPEAPEASMSYCSTPLSQSPPPVHSPLSQNPRQRMLAPTDLKTFGSAKRKASHQFRVPQYSPSPNGSPFGAHFRSVDSPYSADGGVEGDAGGAEGAATNSISSQTGGSSAANNGQGLSLPIYVAGTFCQEAAEGEDSSHSGRAGSSREINGDIPTANGLNLSTSSRELGSKFYLQADGKSLRVKEEPGGSEELYENQAIDLSTDDLNRSHILNDTTAAYPLVSANSLILSGNSLDSLPSQVPYSALSMLAAARRGEALIMDGDGLTIKYTSTGPYTVGANGKDVSNSSRIKDIIMYDDQSPLNTQKGARIETDFIVDKLGMDGRKRRRRAPEDQLTPEEIAEYLGHEREHYSFKCKYCPDEFDSVTRYIHHSVAAHQAYICHQCGKSFTTKSSLLRHRPIHTGMRRFACSICKKTFYRKDKCKAHIKRHLGVDQTSDPAHVARVEQAQVEVAE